LHITYTARDAEPGEEPQTVVPVQEVPYAHDNGRLIVESILGQDMMAWVTQGPVARRDIEILSKSDFGIVMYRNMMLENVDRVERGEQPKGLLFDAERNRVSIPVIREDNALQAMRPEDGGPRIRNVNTQMISAGI
jgi:5,5'-dehydrodivanillate O-demethylase